MRRILGLGFLLALALTCAAVAAINRETRVALVIGNGAYQHADPLANPPHDAEALSRKLESLDFDVTTAVDLTRREMEEAVLRFGRESEGADLVLIFFAGHGMRVDGENYLLPVDASVEDRNDLDQAAVEEARLHSVFAFVEPKVSVLILDACRNNPFVDVLGSGPGLASGGAAENELGPRSRPGLLIVFSAAPGEVASDGEDSGNSPFTTALLQAIDKPGGIEINALFRNVRNTVYALSEGQLPWMEGSPEEVWLRPPEPETPKASLERLLAASAKSFSPLEREAVEAWLRPDRRLVRVASAGTLASDASTLVEQLSWLSIRESPDPAVYRAFLEDFPDGIFAELARDRQAALEVAAAQAAEDVSTGAIEVAGGSPEMAAEGVDEARLAAAETDLGLTADQRVALQRLLGETGRYRGELDGAIGPMSRAALQAFQADADLPPTGYVDRRTLSALIAGAAGPLLTADLAEGARSAIHELAAIARSGAGAAPTVVRVASIARHPEVHAYWRRVADGFEAEHPGVRVAFDAMPGPEYKEKLLGMLGADAPPDIFFTWGGGHLRALGNAGFARDLTEEMGAGWAWSFKPGALDNLRIDGRVYAVPSQLSLVSLWANRRLLDKAGVDPDTLRSWDGILSAVPRLKASGIVPISVAGADRWPLQLYWGGLAQAIGGRAAFKGALTGEGAGFEGPAFIEASERLQELARLEPFQPDYEDFTSNEAVGAFIGGWMAMTLTGDWTYPQMVRNWPGGPERAAEELVRVPFPPTGLGREAAMTYGGSDGWVLREGAPDAALTFLERLAGLEVQTELARMGQAVPSIAGADTAMQSPVLRGVATELTSSGYHQLFVDQYLGPQAGEVVNDVAVALVNGDLIPQRASSEIERAWAKVRPSAALRVTPPAGAGAPDAPAGVE